MHVKRDVGEKLALQSDSLHENQQQYFHIFVWQQLFYPYQFMMKEKGYVILNSTLLFYFTIPEVFFCSKLTVKVSKFI